MFIPVIDVSQDGPILVVWNMSTGETYIGMILGWVPAEQPTLWNPVILNANTGQAMTIDTTDEAIDTKFALDIDTATRMHDSLIAE